MKFSAASQNTDQLLNIHKTEIDQTALDTIMEQPVITPMDSRPNFTELDKAIPATKYEKASGECGISAEV